MPIEILYEDKHILVVNKPSNMPTQSDPTGDMDLLTTLKNQISNSPNKVYLGLHHRLDRPVGGCILFTKTHEINKSIAQQIQKHSIRKTYLCVVCGTPTLKSGQLIHHLKKFSDINMSKVVNSNVSNSKEAILNYECLSTIEHSELGPLSLLKVQLKTGRHHQIRVQLAAVNMPILGDRKYNTNKFAQNFCNIALLSHQLSFYHVFKKDFIQATALPILDSIPWNEFDISSSLSKKKQIDEP